MATKEIATTKNIYQKLLLIQQSINGLGKDKLLYDIQYEQ
jgi:hypothetical protein